VFARPVAATSANGLTEMDATPWKRGTEWYLRLIALPGVSDGHRRLTGVQKRDRWDANGAIRTRTGALNPVTISPAERCGPASCPAICCPSRTLYCDASLFRWSGRRRCTNRSYRNSQPTGKAPHNSRHRDI